MSARSGRGSSKSPTRKSASSSKSENRKKSGTGSRTKSGTSTRTKSGKSSKTGGGGQLDTRSAVERDLSRLATSPGGVPTSRQSTYSTTTLNDDPEPDPVVEDRIPSPDMIALQNPAANPRLMRRIIAEDEEWSLATVSPLANICLDNIVKTFDVNSLVLNKLPPKDRAHVLESIPTSLPLRITARLVDDDGYWKKCCRERWRVCDVAQHGGRWKRMFFERNLQDILQKFVPGLTDPTELEETLFLSANYVRCLDIRQLLPPVRLVTAQRPNKRGNANARSSSALPGVLPDLMEDSESDAGLDESEPLTEHLDFNSILPKLPFLEDFRVRYGVRNCGMNFDWNLFLFTSRDCELLSRCIASCRTLRKLKIRESKVDDDKARTLIKHIIDHPVLHDLDLSHNLISDRGARAIGKFINNRSQLTHLNLSNNAITTNGALAIAHALTKNDTLVHLDLRLNQIGDEGGQAICRALLRNATLQELNLAGNEMSEPAASAMARLLFENKTLRKLDLSSNRFGRDGGQQLKESMSENQTLTFIDLRLTDCGQDTELYIQQRIANNKNLVSAK